MGACTADDRVLAAARSRWEPPRTGDLIEDCAVALFAAKTGLWEHDLRTQRFSAHDTMLRLLGLDPLTEPLTLEEWNRRTMHPDDFPGWHATYQRHVAGATPEYEHTHRRRHRDGQYRWLFSRGRVERDAQGRPVRMLGIATDITDLKRARDSLRQSQDRMREIAEYTSDVYWLLEAPAGKALYVSATFERIWGYPASEVLEAGRDWLQAVVPEDRAMLAAMDLCRRCDGWDVSFRVTRADGEVRWVRARGFPILGDGTPERIAIVMKDVTQEQAEGERRLDDLRLQSRLLVREVHHRIKNSLQGMIGLLSIRAREHPEVTGLLNEAIGQIESIALVHGLQGAQGEGNLDIAGLTRAIVDTARRWSLSDAGVELTGDAQVNRRLAQDKGVAVALILNELLTNAIKHQSPATDGTIRVELHACAERVSWRVVNAGTLPAAVDLAPGQGLGTGLNLVRSMLPPRGARLQFESGAGTVTAQLDLEPPVIVD